MIKGLGIDLVKIEKTENLLKMFGDRFLRKVFTESEIQEGKNRALPAQEFSVLFAAKEAVQKCLGVRMFTSIKFREIEILSRKGNKPLVKLLGKAKEMAEKLGGGQIHLSLSHEGGYALAVAIFEKSEEGG